MRIAIIGASGFIGRELTASLKERGHDLLLFSRNPANGGLHSNFDLDLLRPADICKQLTDVQLVYYLVSASIPTSTWNNPVAEIDMNLVPFVRFLENLEGTSVRKVAFVSSAGTVYGRSGTSIREDAEKHPFSPYGITKLAMEHFLSYFHARNGLHADIYRVSNVYGPGQDTTKGLGLINTFLEKIHREGQVSVFGDGSNLRNYIYVKDVAELMTLSAAGDLDSSHTLNVASEDNLTINQIVDIIRTVIDIPFNVKYHSARPSDNPAIVPDNTRIKEIAKDFRFTPIEEGISKTYKSIIQRNR